MIVYATGSAIIATDITFECTDFVIDEEEANPPIIAYLNNGLLYVLDGESEEKILNSYNLLTDISDLMDEEYEYFFSIIDFFRIEECFYFSCLSNSGVYGTFSLDLKTKKVKCFGLVENYTYQMLDKTKKEYNSDGALSNAGDTAIRQQYKLNNNAQGDPTSTIEVNFPPIDNYFKSKSNWDYTYWGGDGGTRDWWDNPYLKRGEARSGSLYKKQLDAQVGVWLDNPGYAMGATLIGDGGHFYVTKDGADMIFTPENVYDVLFLGKYGGKFPLWGAGADLARVVGNKVFFMSFKKGA